ncbi:hypothetical protein ACFQRB_19550 [Halobaculum litoreum]|uniref:Uncharacterized protein n=1 Tax=Halobaculum litoreum TaxID=3031998 RepID=A0ABD5XSJ1_9EURY
MPDGDDVAGDEVRDGRRRCRRLGRHVVTTPSEQPAVVEASISASHDRRVTRPVIVAARGGRR